MEQNEDFSFALMCLKDGRKMTRRGWNNSEIWVKLIEAEGHTFNFDAGVGKNPFIVIFTADKTIIPWYSSHSDLLAEDWHIV